MFTVIPAIDLKEGKCVRLLQGKADKATVYSTDPVEMALAWQARGARYLHVVDLDGAFNGRPEHTRTIVEIARALAIPVEAGGGLRAEADMAFLLDGGVDRVIIGTAALEGPSRVEKLVARFGEKLVVGIDAVDGMAQVQGWVKTTGVRAVDLGRQMADLGVSLIIHTDTSTDGMMTGVNLAAASEMCSEVKCGVIASGGVAGAEDIKALIELGLPNLQGAIVGKALYEGRFELSDVQ